MDFSHHFSQSKPAFGGPGIPPRWSPSAKDGVGTAYSTSSHVWYTVFRGILSEIYYPTIDRPQIRDLQYLIGDNQTFVHEEKRHLQSQTEALSPHSLGFRITNIDPDGRYKIVKEILGNPHQNSLLISTKILGEKDFLKKLHLYVLLAPHLQSTGWGNNGYFTSVAGKKILVACKDDAWLALAATIPFTQGSCGYVGASDGWTDLMDNHRMDWEFDSALDGNIALTGALDWQEGTPFTLGLAFGNSFHNAVTVLFQSLDVPFPQHQARFIEQWDRLEGHVLPLDQHSEDEGKLFHMSHSLLAAHEDKRYQGAMIASLSVPWGETKGDEDLGGYHLVWTRDLYQSATGLLASGSIETPLRALIYLAATQQEEGGFYQNFWINGEPYWRGIQLDEVSFPIILAWRLHAAGLLRQFDPYPMVMQAARYLIENGPATPQDRWEENSGYSPSTLASNIAALTCAASFAESRNDKKTAAFIQQYADFLERHVVAWTVTTQGTLLPDIKRHFIRIKPVDPNDPHPDEDPNHGVLLLNNQSEGNQAEFDGKEIVDAGFLELVRYGVMKPNDPLIEDSLQVIDKILKVETPLGPCWRRYNHDGYGEKEDGSPYDGSGRGRAWPLLTGERGHYELAAGRDVHAFVRAMEGFAKCTGLLPEQIWDTTDLPKSHLFLGRPTGSAMPLMWAHSEYIKLLRSIQDGRAFDLIAPVTDRYWKKQQSVTLEIWKFNRQPQRVTPGTTLRILAPLPFVLHWTSDEWQKAQDTRSTETSISIEFVDIEIPFAQRAPTRFTFYWPLANQWEGREFQVSVEK